MLIEVDRAAWILEHPMVLLQPYNDSSHDRGEAAHFQLYLTRHVEFGFGNISDWYIGDCDRFELSRYLI